MASNRFGKMFTFTTWGESHGKAIGVVIDGCPAGLPIAEEEIHDALAQRAPGKNPYTSPRTEPDVAEILSGVFEGLTTGAPICIMIPNRDADSSKYESIKEHLRPGHANFTYLEKYGIFDYRGGGRSSARETACRVAAGAVARKFLKCHGIDLAAYIVQIGNVKAEIPEASIEKLRQMTYQSAVFCPDEDGAALMMAQIEESKSLGDSLGGLIEFRTAGVKPGLGDPVYEKLEACLAYAMMSLPASKGFEIGSGLKAVAMPGSGHNDRFVCQNGKVQTATNHSGGVLGGISTGMPIIGRVAFKPTSSIMKPQETIKMSGETALFELPQGSRHDPCVAIRAVPVVEAMASLVLADALLMNECARVR